MLWRWSVQQGAKVTDRRWGPAPSCTSVDGNVPGMRDTVSPECSAETTAHSESVLHGMYSTELYIQQVPMRLRRDSPCHAGRDSS